MSTQPLVLLQQEGPITFLTLNRPEKRNALNSALLKELCRAIDKTAKDNSQRILILRGAGPAFCAGLDLEESSHPKKADSMAREVARMLLTVHECPLITIACVHGAAVAGGAGLMSACDLAVVSEDALIGYPEVRRGLVAALVTTFLHRQLGERDVRELLLTGELIQARRARQIGLVSRVAPAAQMGHEIHHLTTSLLMGGPLALLKTKKNLDAHWPTTVKQDLQRALKQHMHARHSKEAEEGIKAFLEKRPAKWRVAT